MLGIKERYPERSVASENASEVVLSMKQEGSSNAEKWTFSKETGLLVGQERVANMGPQGNLPIKSMMSDYREVNGVMAPHRIDVENPAFKASMILNSLRFNVDVDPKVFDPPF